MRTVVPTNLSTSRGEVWRSTQYVNFKSLVHPVLYVVYIPVMDVLNVNNVRCFLWDLAWD